MDSILSKPTQHAFLKVLAVWLTADVGLTFLHIGLRGLVGLDMINEVPSLFSLFGDHSSLSEWFIYAKWTFTVGLLFLTWKNGGQILFLCLAVVFTIVLVDDFGQVHERAGTLLSTQFPATRPFGVPIHQFGELVAWLALSVPVIGLFAWGCFTAEGWARRCGFIFLGLFAGLIFFAIGIDTFGVLIGDPGYWLSYALSTTECVGEMVMASGIASFATAVWLESKTSDVRSGLDWKTSRLMPGGGIH